MENNNNNDNSFSSSEEDYEYKCPVPDCTRRIVDKIPKKGFFICGIPKHVCDDCKMKGWKHLSGHGGDDETWNPKLSSQQH